MKGAWTITLPPLGVSITSVVAFVYVARGLSCEKIPIDADASASIDNDCLLVRQKYGIETVFAAILVIRGNMKYISAGF